MLYPSTPKKGISVSLSKRAQSNNVNSNNFYSPSKFQIINDYSISKQKNNFYGNSEAHSYRNNNNANNRRHSITFTSSNRPSSVNDKNINNKTYDNFVSFNANQNKTIQCNLNKQHIPITGLNRQAYFNPNFINLSNSQFHQHHKPQNFYQITHRQDNKSTIQSTINNETSNLSTFSNSFHSFTSNSLIPSHRYLQTNAEQNHQNVNIEMKNHPCVIYRLQTKPENNQNNINFKRHCSLSKSRVNKLGINQYSISRIKPQQEFIQKREDSLIEKKKNILKHMQNNLMAVNQQLTSFNFSFSNNKNNNQRIHNNNMSGNQQLFQFSANKRPLSHQSKAPSHVNSFPIKQIQPQSKKKNITFNFNNKESTKVTFTNENCFQNFALSRYPVINYDNFSNNKNCFNKSNLHIRSNQSESLWKESQSKFLNKNEDFKYTNFNNNFPIQNNFQSSLNFLSNSQNIRSNSHIQKQSFNRNQLTNNNKQNKTQVQKSYIQNLYSSAKNKAPLAPIQQNYVKQFTANCSPEVQKLKAKNVAVQTSEKFEKKQNQSSIKKKQGKIKRKKVRGDRLMQIQNRLNEIIQKVNNY